VSVTVARGFRAAGVAAGLKPSGALDVAVVANDGPSDGAAGVFTANRVKAAPVLWSEQVLTGGRVRAVVLNAGCANACTGSAGFPVTRATAEAAAAALAVDAGAVAVCSTGKIGELPPRATLLAGVDKAVAALSDTGKDRCAAQSRASGDAEKEQCAAETRASRNSGGSDAAAAILTTDTVLKQAAVTAAGFAVGGMAKGAGMLAPSLATMLAVLTTDAVAEPPALNVALREACRTTFERVDVDGCLSTNDTVLLLTSGASGVQPPYGDLAAAVHGVCADLAGQLVADAEGASKQVDITVTGAAGEDDAVEVARAIARSNLLKCALAGGDPNWGRILAAVGTTGAAYDPLALDAAINGVWVCRDTGPAADPTTVDLTGAEVAVEVDLRCGEHRATVRTTDLTADYVSINADYST
jgi:glutamate N-acetyltransferase/amino-acid N-acetyltransferase